MNIDNLIEQLHLSNMEERQKERIRHIHFRPWWLAVPTAAAIALLVMIPNNGKADPKPVTGLHVYCNNNCQKDDALEIIRQNISEIQTTVIEEQ